MSDNISSRSPPYRLALCNNFFSQTLKARHKVYLLKVPRSQTAEGERLKLFCLIARLTIDAQTMQAVQTNVCLGFSYLHPETRFLSAARNFIAFFENIHAARSGILQCRSALVGFSVSIATTYQKGMSTKFTHEILQFTRRPLSCVRHIFLNEIFKTVTSA